MSAILSVATPLSFILIAPEPSVALNSIVEPSTVASISSAPTVIPSPPTALIVTSPVTPDGVVKPLPAVIDVISPAILDQLGDPYVVD